VLTRTPLKREGDYSPKSIGLLAAGCGQVNGSPGGAALAASSAKQEPPRQFGTGAAENLR
jgi:hypothetical protein